MENQGDVSKALLSSLARKSMSCLKTLTYCTWAGTQSRLLGCSSQSE